MEHELKTTQPFFERVWTGEKPFELRRNDRGYQVGDLLILREYVPPTLPLPLLMGTYTGRRIHAQVTYVLTGIVDGFDLADRAILGLRIEHRETEPPEPSP